MSLSYMSSDLIIISLQSKSSVKLKFKKKFYVKPCNCIQYEEFIINTNTDFIYFFFFQL